VLTCEFSKDTEGCFIQGLSVAQIKQEIRTISILCEGLYFFVARGLEVSVDTSLKGNKKPANRVICGFL